ncbi:MAG: ATP-binding protein [Candidatus Cloacimonadales bacterium]
MTIILVYVYEIVIVILIIFIAFLLFLYKSNKKKLRECRINKEDLQNKNTFLNTNLVDNNPAAIQIIDHNGFSIHYNQSFIDLFGYIPADDINIFEDERLLVHGFKELLQRVKNGESTIFPVFDYNPHHSNKTFEDKELSLKMTAYSIQESPDKPRTYIFSYYDETEKAQALSALIKSESIAHTVIDNSPIGIVVRSNTGRLLLYNQAWIDIWEIKSEELARELQNKDTLQFEGWKEAYDEHLQNVRNVYLNGGEYTSSEIYTNDKGDPKDYPRIVTQRFSSVCNKMGQVEFVVIFTTDITEQKRQEEERLHLNAQLGHSQKMESIGRLAGGISHDFNNMLSVIIGYSDMAILNADENEPIHGYLSEINKAAIKSANLTRQLLAFARKQTINPVEIDLNMAVNGLKKMLNRLIGENIKLIFSPSQSEILIKFDSSQLDQILANLCVNARDAIKGNGIIEIKTDIKYIKDSFSVFNPELAAGEYALLSVNDNGCGMDEETIENIFEPFFTTKEQGEGTGLGLATVYGIIKQNNGFIEVMSQIDAGSSFNIYLPIFNKEVDGSTAERNEQMANMGYETVLLVEDEFSLLDMAQDMLNLHGYHVLSANSGKEAMKIIDEYEGKIHLLITDLVMPEINGKQVADYFFEKRNTGQCLYMSGYTDNIIDGIDLNNNSRHFIQKPFDIEKFTKKTRKVLDSGKSSNEEDC